MRSQAQRKPSLDRSVSQDHSRTGVPQDQRAAPPPLVLPDPESLHLQPSISPSDPQPSSPSDPQPSFLHRGPSTFIPTPWTPGPKLFTRNPKPESQNPTPQPSTLKSEPSTPPIKKQLKSSPYTLHPAPYPLPPKLSILNPGIDKPPSQDHRRASEPCIRTGVPRSQEIPLP